MTRNALQILLRISGGIVGITFIAFGTFALFGHVADGAYQRYVIGPSFIALGAIFVFYAVTGRRELF